MTIQMLLLQGASIAVDIVGGIAEDIQAGGTATASYDLTSTGSETVSPGGASGTWLLSGAASAYDVRATIVSGTVSTGTTGSWLNLGTSRTWTKSRNVIGSASVVLTIEVRRTSDGVVLDTASVTLTATIDSS